MASDPFNSDLLRSSVLVTGSHYSMTTLVGRLLSAAPEFHLLHEPANARPTLSYDSLKPPHWYEFYEGQRIEMLGQFLTKTIEGRGLSREIVSRSAQIRSAGQMLQVGRYLSRKLPMKIARKPAIIKDPFLLFAARDLQLLTQMRVIITVRHPCAFAESFKRAGNGFDFTNLLQPQVLEAMPGDAMAIEKMADSAGSLIEQATLLWRVLYGFAAQYLLGNDRTMYIRQEEVVSEASAAIDRLFTFAGATRTAAVDHFVTKNLSAGTTDFNQSGSYIKRNSKATLNKWRGRLSPGEIATIREAAAEVATNFGYGEGSWAGSGAKD